MKRFTIKASGWVLFLAPFLMALSLGETAPDFRAKNQDGKSIRLSDYKGKYVLLYFYPKDETPGCTQEACSFRDVFSQFSKANAVVFGISKQDEKSHLAFKNKHKLPFDLLVDSEGTLAESYDIGTIPLLGISKRQSVLIGPDSKVVRIYKKVDPKKHSEEVLRDIKNLSNSSQ